MKSSDSTLGEMHIYYDGDRPDMVSYNGAMYRYVHSLQGDILGLQDSTGAMVVVYRYDPWGRPVWLSGSLSETLGALNPFRYRGYVYDTESGLYYLRSRYYNPNWGRFISSDSILGHAGGLLQHNIFAYSGNGPVCRIDSCGTAWYDLFSTAVNSISNWWTNDVKALWTEVKTFGKKVVLSIDVLVGGISVDAGVGLGIGAGVHAGLFSAEMGFRNDIVHLSVDTDKLRLGRTYEYSMEASAGLGNIDNLSTGIDFSSTHYHPFFDPKCTCDLPIVGFTANCPAIEHEVETDESISFGISWYFFVGYNISIDYSISKVGRELRAVW